MEREDGHAHGSKRRHFADLTWEVFQCACSPGPVHMALASQCACSQSTDHGFEPARAGCGEANAFHQLVLCLLRFVLCTGGSVRSSFSSRRSSPMQPEATCCHPLACCLEEDPRVGKALSRLRKGSGAPVPSA